MNARIRGEHYAPLTEAEQIAAARARGTTYYIAPYWTLSGADEGFAYFVARDVATAAMVEEDDDLTRLVARMTERHPQMQLIENGVTIQHGITSALRAIPKGGRL